MRKRRNSTGVYLRKDGRWDWQIVNGRNAKGNPNKVARGISRTEQEAIEARTQALAKLHLGEPVKEEKQTLGSFMETWLGDMVEGKKAPKTVRFYTQMTRLYIIPGLGQVPLGKLNAQQIQSFLNQKAKERQTYTRKGSDGKPETVEKEPLSPGTIGHIRSTLRAALEIAWKWSLIRENPAKKVTLPAKAEKEAIYLTPEEAAALIEKAQGHYLGDLIKLALNTGLRLGEATGLTWTDVALEKGFVSVKQQLQRVDGKFALRELKTKNSRRTLPLTRSAKEALESQKANQLLWSTVEDSANTLGLVFTTTKGRPLDPKTVDENLKAFALAAGIEKPISFHKLRHTAGTHLVANGVPLNVVKEILGHSQIAITANLYAHAVPAAHKAAFDVLEQAYRVSS